MNRPRILIAAAALVAVACTQQGQQQPDWSAGVPVLNDRGEIAGTAVKEDVDRAAEGGAPAEVRDNNGALVGHYGPEGFVPLPTTSNH